MGDLTVECGRTSTSELPAGEHLMPTFKRSDRWLQLRDIDAVAERARRIVPT